MWTENKTIKDLLWDRWTISWMFDLIACRGGGWMYTDYSFRSLPGEHPHPPYPRQWLISLSVLCLSSNRKLWRWGWALSSGHCKGVKMESWPQVVHPSHNSHPIHCEYSIPDAECAGNKSIRDCKNHIKT